MLIRRIMEINTYFERSAIFNNSLLKVGKVTMFDLVPPVTPLFKFRIKENLLEKYEYFVCQKLFCYTCSN